MAKSWESYLPQVQPQVRGCPHLTMIQAVRNAAIDLAEASLILRADHAPIDSVVDQIDYPLTPPSSTKIITLLAAKYDGVPITPLPETEADGLSPYWRGNNIPNRYYLSDPSVLTLTWAPDEVITGAIEARIVYRPDEASTEGDDLLYRDWLRYIAAGALARLKDMPSEKWSGDSRRDWLTFNTGKSFARSAALRGHTIGSNTIKQRPFGGRGGSQWR